MANYVERVALAGAFFFGLQLWEGYRGQRSRDLFFAERAAGGSLPAVSLDGALAERRSVVGAAKPILNVKAFSAENLEVRVCSGGADCAGAPRAAARARAMELCVTLSPTPTPHHTPTQGVPAPPNSR